MERSADFLRQRMDDMVRRCRDAGMNVTPQRMAVYRALLESEDHPSPEMLYQEVRQSMPSLSLATIYKTLEALERLGLVHEVALISDSRRYDANLSSHHHLVCSDCEKVVDFYSDAYDRLLPRKKVRGFIPHSVSVSITGVCDDCNSLTH